MKLKGRPLDDNGAIEFENTPTSLKQRITELERERDAFKLEMESLADLVTKYDNKVETLEQKLSDLRTGLYTVIKARPMRRRGREEIFAAIERSR